MDDRNRHLMVLFDKRTTANLVATASLHIILAAGLTRLSAAVQSTFAFSTPTTSRHLVFFLVKKAQSFRQRILHIFSRDVEVV